MMTNMAALSLVNSHMFRFPNMKNYLKGTVQFLEGRIVKLPSDPFKSLILKSLVNGHFELPVFLGSGQEVIPFLFDTGASFVTMPASEYYKIPKSNKRETGTSVVSIADGSNISLSTAILKEFAIGPWKLSNVKVGYCESCEPLLGMSAIRNFRYDYNSKGELHTLTIRAKQ